jgi:hypothetical protein
MVFSFLVAHIVHGGAVTGIIRCIFHIIIVIRAIPVRIIAATRRTAAVIAIAASAVAVIAIITAAGIIAASVIAVVAYRVATVTAVATSAVAVITARIIASIAAGITASGIFAARSATTATTVAARAIIAVIAVIAVITVGILLTSICLTYINIIGIIIAHCTAASFHPSGRSKAAFAENLSIQFISFNTHAACHLMMPLTQTSVNFMMAYRHRADPQILRHKYTWLVS